jgi:hypothetical protein
MAKIKNWSKLKNPEKKYGKDTVAAWKHDETNSVVDVSKTPDRIIKKFNRDGSNQYAIFVSGGNSRYVAGSEKIGSAPTKSQALTMARGYMKRNTDEVKMPMNKR